MRIDDYLGLVVVVELDTTAIHEGVLEDVEGTHVKVINGAETWVIPRNEIVKITPVRTIGFTLSESSYWAAFLLLNNKVVLVIVMNKSGAYAYHLIRV